MMLLDPSCSIYTINTPSKTSGIISTFLSLCKEPIRFLGPCVIQLCIGLAVGTLPYWVPTKWLEECDASQRRFTGRHRPLRYQWLTNTSRPWNQSTRLHTSAAPHQRREPEQPCGSSFSPPRHQIWYRLNHRNVLLAQSHETYPTQPLSD
jgi:hypothetical protein